MRRLRLGPQGRPDHLSLFLLLITSIIGYCHYYSELVPYIGGTPTYRGSMCRPTYMEGYPDEGCPLCRESPTYGVPYIALLLYIGISIFGFLYVVVSLHRGTTMKGGAYTGGIIDAHISLTRPNGALCCHYTVSCCHNTPLLVTPSHNRFSEFISLHC